MSGYRLYFLNARGHINRRVEIEAEDDASAIAAVAEHRDGREMELWTGERIVRVFAESSASRAKEHA